MFNTTDPPPRHEGNPRKRHPTTTFKNVGLGIGGLGAGYAGLRIAQAAQRVGPAAESVQKAAQGLSTAAESVQKSTPAYAGSKLKELARKFWHGTLKAQRFHSLLGEIRFEIQFAKPGEMTGLFLPESEDRKSRPWQMITKAALEKTESKEVFKTAMTPEEDRKYNELVLKHIFERERAKNKGHSAEDFKEMQKRQRQEVRDFPVTRVGSIVPPQPNVRKFRSAVMATDVPGVPGSKYGEYEAERRKLEAGHRQEILGAAGAPKETLEKMRKAHLGRVNKLKQRLYPQHEMLSRREAFRSNIARNFAIVSPAGKITRQVHGGSFEKTPSGLRWVGRESPGPKKQLQGFKVRSTGIRQVLQKRGEYLKRHGITEEVPGKGLIGSTTFLRQATPEQRGQYSEMITGLQKKLSEETKRRLAHREMRAGQLVAATQNRAARHLRRVDPNISDKSLLNTVQRATMAPPHESKLPYRGTSKFAGGIFGSTTPLEGVPLAEAASAIGISSNRAERLRRLRDVSVSSLGAHRIRSQILSRGDIFRQVRPEHEYPYQGFKKIGRVVKKIFRFEVPKVGVAEKLLKSIKGRKFRRELVYGGALAGGITAADTVVSAVNPDPNTSRAQSAWGGAKRGALYGAVLAGTEPFLRKPIRQIVKRFESSVPEIRLKGLYKRLGNMVIVGKAGQSAEDISRKNMERIAMRQGPINKIMDWSRKLEASATGESPKTMGQVRDEWRKRLAQKDNGIVLGTVAEGKKGKRFYISRATVGGDQSLREVYHHEHFHTRPYVGHSEILAHYVGRAMREKGKFHPIEGLKGVGHLIGTRPSRFAIEAAPVAGAAVGIRKLTKKKEEQKFAARDQPDATIPRDIAVGSIEAGVGFLATERLLSKLKQPTSKWGRFGVAAGVGGLSTGAIGYGVNRLIRSKKAQKEMSSKLKEIRFDSEGDATLYNPKKRLTVAQDRYRKAVREREINRKEANLAKSALAGGALGGLLKGKIGAGVGAAAGLAASSALTLRNRRSRDPFGEESISSKRVERLPYQVPAAVVGGIAARGLYRRIPAIKKYAGHFFQEKTEQDKIDEVFGRRWKKEFLPRRWEETRLKIVRGQRLARDVRAKLTGDLGKDARGRERKPEWKKPWAAGLAGGALFGAGVAGLKLVGSGPWKRGVIRVVRGPHKPSTEQLRKVAQTGEDLGWSLRPARSFTESQKRQFGGARFEKTAQGSSKMVGLPKDYAPQAPAGPEIPGRTTGFPSGGYPVGSKKRWIAKAHGNIRLVRKDVRKFWRGETQKMKTSRIAKQAEQDRTRAMASLSKLRKSQTGQPEEYASRLREIRFQDQGWRVRERSTHTAIVKHPQSRERKARRQKEGLEIKRNRDLAAAAAIGSAVPIGAGIPVAWSRFKKYRAERAKPDVTGDFERRAFNKKLAEELLRKNAETEAAKRILRGAGMIIHKSSRAPLIQFQNQYKIPGIQKRDVRLLKKHGPEKEALKSAATFVPLNAAIYGTAGAVWHGAIKQMNNPALNRFVHNVPKWKWAGIGAGIGAGLSSVAVAGGYRGNVKRAKGLKKYPKSIGELGRPGFTGSYPEHSGTRLLKQYFAKNDSKLSDRSPLISFRDKDEDKLSHKAGRIARTAALGGLAGRIGAYRVIRGGPMNKATLIGAGIGGLAQVGLEHIASAKKGLHGQPINVKPESRESVRGYGKGLGLAGIAGAHLIQSAANLEDVAGIQAGEMVRGMGLGTTEEHAERMRAYYERIQRGNTFIPRPPKFAKKAAERAGFRNPNVTADETGGDLEAKLTRLAKGAKGTPEGEAAQFRLNRLRERQGKTFVGRTKKRVSGLVSRFKPRRARKIVGHLLSTLDDLINFESITYHETASEIHRRKAGVHQEKSGYGSTGAVLAAGLGAVGLKTGIGGRAIRNMVRHSPEKVSKWMAGHPRLTERAFYYSPAAALGTYAAGHQVAAWGQKRKASKEQKLAQVARRERNAQRKLSSKLDDLIQFQKNDDRDESRIGNFFRGGFKGTGYGALGLGAYGGIKSAIPSAKTATHQANQQYFIGVRGPMDKALGPGGWRKMTKEMDSPPIRKYIAGGLKASRKLNKSRLLRAGVGAVGAGIPGAVAGGAIGSVYGLFRKPKRSQQQIP